MARGRLRIYLGAAPGVGKTYAMLNEGFRRRERGKDIVAAYIETHGRPNTGAQLRDLEVIPRRVLRYRDQDFEEMDLDAVLARHPSVALVDELAHTNIPGSRNDKRWRDIDEMLDAGIDVISTVNIQHLESLSDVVQGITGVLQRERVPDHVVRAADQIELVDMSPESLRRRMAHGNIYRPDKVDAALGNYFRIGNLSALRELALLWVADRVDEGLQEYRERHGIAEPWETKERVVVALTGSPRGERLIRRGARMAARSRAELVGIHVRPTDGLTSGANELLEAHRALLVELDGRYNETAGNDTAAALVDFARSENATQILLGASNRSRWAQLLKGSVINQVIRRADGMDVHVLSGDEAPSTGRRLPRLPGRHHLAALPFRRTLAGWVLAMVGLPLLALALTQFRSSLGPTLGLPEQLLAVVLVAAVGGLFPAVAGSLVAFALTDWYLIPPIHSFTISRSSDVVALVVFVLTAVLVAMLIDRLARRSLETTRARAESEALARMAGGAVLAGAKALPRLVEDLRATFGVDAVAVLSPAVLESAVLTPESAVLESAVLTPDGTPDATTGEPGRAAPDPAVPAGVARAGSWTVVAAAGEPIPKRPEDGVLCAELAGGSVLVISGSTLAADDRRLLSAFVAQLRLAQDQEELTRTAASATSLAEANELRTALLAAVSHDLRTPLASIKASISSLLSNEVTWPAETVAAFHDTIDTEADRLNTLVGNLLDMSRLQTGVLHLALRPVGLEEVVFAALASISGDASSVEVEVPETLPPVEADPALLERAVANLVGNALTWNRPGSPVTVRAGIAPAHPGSVRLPPDGDGPAPHAAGDRIELRVADRGPGIPEDHREAVFLPFQRLGDARSDGVGLGLAVARGFVEAMQGELTLEDTPGGGLTAVISLPFEPGADSVSAAPEASPRTADPSPAPVAHLSPAAVGVGREDVLLAGVGTDDVLVAGVGTDAATDARAGPAE